MVVSLGGVVETPFAWVGAIVDIKCGFVVSLFLILFLWLFSSKTESEENASELAQDSPCTRAGDACE